MIMPEVKRCEKCKQLDLIEKIEKICPKCILEEKKRKNNYLKI